MISVLLWELGCDLEPGAIRNGCPDFAAVGGDDGLGNGKTDSMATGLGITGGIHPVKTFEKNIGIVLGKGD